MNRTPASQHNVRTVAVWLDDIRPMPAGFDVHVKTSKEAIELLRTRRVRKISLDHDLGEVAFEGHRRVDPGDGYQVACAIEEMANFGEIPRIEVSIHSANPIGRRRMEEALAWAQKCWEDQESAQ